MMNKPSMRLPAHVTVGDVAEASRVGLKAFLAVAPDKRSLAEWLVGPYKDAIRFGPPRLNQPGDKDSVPPADIGDIIRGAKTAIMSAIDAATSPGAEALVLCLPPVVHVTPVYDVTGARGFVPFDVARAKLTDRVLSLLVSDYLTRPDDFLTVVPPWIRAPRGPRSGVSTRVSVDNIMAEGASRGSAPGKLGT